MSEDSTYRAPNSEPMSERDGLYLLVVEPHGCEHYPLPTWEGEVLVGRGSSEGVQLESNQVSRKHARFRVHSGRVEVEDLGSTNGTWCNGGRLPPREARQLEVGDQVTIGSSQLFLQRGHAARARQSMLKEGMIEVLLHNECVRCERDPSNQSGVGGAFARMLVSMSKAPKELDTVVLATARKALDWQSRVAVYGDCTTNEQGNVVRWREFALLLPRTTPQRAEGAMSQIAASLRQGSIKCRIGLVTCPGDGQHWHALTQEAYLRARGVQQGDGEPVPTGPLMTRIEECIKQCAAVDSTVLLLGATGVGKTTLAQRIHHRSRRRDFPFVTVNCPALPQGLAEAELFGYERGAFTGAEKKGKPGFFKMADHGTLFLDEVGRLPPCAQSKLLTAMSASSTVRTVRRLGAIEEETVDVRIIAATNEDLAAKVRAGAFLEDLFHRLTVIDIVVPSLCERREEIAPLARNYVKLFAARNGLSRIPRVTEEAMAALEGYGWPGNLRELFNVIERAVTLCNGSEIALEDLSERVRAPSEHGPPGQPERQATLPPEAPKASPESPASEDVFDVLKAHRWDERRAARRLGLTEEELGARMKSLIERLLDEHHGNVSKVRRVIGASPEKFYKLMRQLGVTRE